MNNPSKTTNTVPSFAIDINNDAPVVCKKSIIIDASKDKVWSELSAIDNWSEWLKVVGKSGLTGPLQTGNSFEWTNEGMYITSKLHTVRINESLGWTGRVMGITAIHNWTLTETNNKTHVCCEESMSGLIARLFRQALIGKLEKSLNNWLEQLKCRCER